MLGEGGWADKEHVWHSDLGESGSYVRRAENIPTCNLVKAESTVKLSNWAQSGFHTISCPVSLNGSQSLKRRPQEKDFTVCKNWIQSFVVWVSQEVDPEVRIWVNIYLEGSGNSSSRVEERYREGKVIKGKSLSKCMVSLCHVTNHSNA